MEYIKLIFRLNCYLSKFEEFALQERYDDEKYKILLDEYEQFEKNNNIDLYWGWRNPHSAMCRVGYILTDRYKKIIINNLMRLSVVKEILQPYLCDDILKYLLSGYII